MAVLADIITFFLLVGGAVSMLIGSYGLLKLPDLFSRMHAAGMVDTLGLGLIMVGLIVQAGFSLVSFKLFLIVVFVFYTGPAVTHALAQAALNAGVKPVLQDNETAREP
ncbi:MAG: monovalent cation/H(+) antiporter subunit G [Alphaproteobacteria bacterium]|nr:monovalent cation/H(+) antiporter subunit G [Alphaproteobacteria bacterium]